MSEVESKQHDTARILRGFCKLAGVVVPLTSATAVALLLKDPDSGDQIRRTATIQNAATGEVRYQPIAADVQTARTFLLEWEVTFADGKVQTFPDGDYDMWTILKDLG